LNTKEKVLSLIGEYCNKEHQYGLISAGAANAQSAALTVFMQHKPRKYNKNKQALSH
jgi:hypothetical protein